MGKGDLEREGYEKVSSRAEAKIKTTWKDNKGRMHITDKLVVGSPGYVRKEASPTMKEQDVHVEFAQTFNTFVKEVKTATADGLVKLRDFVEEQHDGIGEEGPLDSSSTTGSSSGYESEPRHETGLTPLQVLKNFVDNLAKDIRLDRAAIIGAFILIAATWVAIAVMQ